MICFFTKQNDLNLSYKLFVTCSMFHHCKKKKSKQQSMEKPSFSKKSKQKIGRSGDVDSVSSNEDDQTKVSK